MKLILPLFINTLPHHQKYSHDSLFRVSLGELHATPDPKKASLHFFLPNTPAPKTPDPPNPWI
jgi:hypothetical protein